MKFSLTCNAADPCDQCKGTVNRNLPRAEMEALVKKVTEEQKGMCAPCFNAGCEPKAKSVKVTTRVRIIDPEEIITVTCWNRQCKHGVATVEPFIRDGKVVKEGYTYPVAAKVQVARKDANGALCDGCKADVVAAEKKEAAKAKRASKKAVQ